MTVPDPARRRDDFVTLRLISTGDNTDRLHYKFQGQKGSLQVGRDATVPWGVMNHLLGDPYYEGRDREIHYANIHHHAGVNPGQPLPYTIEAYDSAGDRIATMVDDPDGIHMPDRDSVLTPNALREMHADLDRRMKQVEQMQREMEQQRTSDDQPPPKTRARRDRREPSAITDPTIGEGSTVAIDNDSDVPDDTPSRVPVT